MKNIGLLFLCLVGVYRLSAQNLVRGPYLQMVTPNSITIRWRTVALEDSKVTFGIASDKLSSSQSSNVASTEHEVQINNLVPNTTYYYAIGSTQRILEGNATNYFTTSPPVGSTQKMRFLALGDCGYLTPKQLGVRDQFLKYAKDKPFNLTLLLGDNAYIYGKDDEFQAGFFDTYQAGLLKKVPVYPATGNHDYGNNPASQISHQVPYFDIFTLPQNGEAGGIPSQSEAYYSYDYGNIHFISLDSYGKEAGEQRMYDTLSPQVVWLKKDLAASKQTWKIVYWHHAPYTKGSYDSDLVEELYLTRRNLLRILERNGVDLVLCGHSHVYERSTLLQKHYGNADTYRQKVHSLSRSNSSARYDGTDNSCPFIKNDRGTVYVVAGTAAVVPNASQASWPHKAMMFSDREHHGSLIFEVENNRLDSKWLCEDGIIRDQFTLMKNVKKNKEITINKGDNLSLTASWIGTYVWQDGTQKQSIDLKNVVNSATYSVSDQQKCLVDSFHVTVVPKASSLDFQLKSFPNPTNGSFKIGYEIPSDGTYQVQISDTQGNVISQFAEEFYEKGSYEKTIQLPENIPSDKNIFLKIQSATIQSTKKIVIIR